MTIDRRTFLGLVAAFTVSPTSAAPSEIAALVNRLSKLKQGEFQYFDIWTWIDLQGRRMIQYGIQTTTDRVVCRKDLDRPTPQTAEEWITRHEPTDPSRHIGSIHDDPFFDPHV